MLARSVAVALVLPLSLIACKDKAQPDYAACVQADTAGEVEKAWDSCNAAITADPNSTSGKAATAKLAEMKPKYDKWKADKAAADAKAAEQKQKEDEAVAKAAAVSQVQELAALRRKIHRNPTFDADDDNCAGQGKPGHSYRYGGGTYDENESVAYADGCKAYDDTAVSVTGHAQNHFCCP